MSDTRPDAHSDTRSARSSPSFQHQAQHGTHPQGQGPTGGEVVVTDDLELLLAALPPRVRSALQEPSLDNLLEIVLDLGRPPEARYASGAVDLGHEPVTLEDLAYVVERIGSFGDDNRAGIGRTLHRISAIRNRAGAVVGLTCRVGRAVRGTVALVRDVIEEGRSLLILGRPGVGKTTLLREAARVLADELGKRVVVVDTSNEIAGDGDVPHPGIGRARRMQVARVAEQHRVMIEAVENHMPEVIVIDEIGTELEAVAARTIAERGVQLIGTAHGRTLENLLLNPTLADLVGGMQAVTLGDEEARRRGTQKTVLERKAPPTFDVLVEQQSWREVLVHRAVAASVDALLRGQPIQAERRERDERDRVSIAPVLVDPAEPAQWAGGGLGTSSLEDDFLGAFGSGRRDSHGRRGTRSRAFDDPRRVPVPGERLDRDDEPEAPDWDTCWDEQIDAAYALEAAEPTGTIGTLAPSVRGGAARFGRDELRRALPARPAWAEPMPKSSKRRSLRIYPFGISRERLEQSARGLRVPVEISADQGEADAVIALKTFYKRQSERLRTAESERKPIYILRTNTVAQIQQCLIRIFDLRASELRARETGEERGQPAHPTTQAMQEAEDAIHRMLNYGGERAELAPQNAYVRRIQHRIAERYNLESRSFGKEPNRHVRIYAR
jgi:stage III sporulation protein SpoIIIAA